MTASESPRYQAKKQRRVQDSPRPTRQAHSIAVGEKPALVRTRMTETPGS